MRVGVSGAIPAALAGDPGIFCGAVLVLSLCGAWVVAVSVLKRVRIDWCCVGVAVVLCVGVFVGLCLMFCVVLRSLFYVCKCGIPWLVLLWLAFIDLGDTER